MKTRRIFASSTVEKVDVRLKTEVIIYTHNFKN